MRRIVMAAACALALACAGGCALTSNGSDTATAVQTADASAYQPLEILESGYDIYGGYVRYAILVHNPNETLEADYVKVGVVVRDASGKVKSDTYTLMRALAPGATAYWAEIAGNGYVTEDDTVEFSVRTIGTGMITPVEGLISELYTVENVTINKMDDIPRLSCTVTLNSLVIDTSIDELHPDVAYVLRDENGAIVSGGVFRKSIDVVYGEPVEFETTMFTDLPPYTTVEVFVFPRS